MNTSLYGRVAVIALVAASTGACDSLGLSDDSSDVSLSFASRQSTSALAAVLVDPIVSGGHTLDLQSVDVSFDEATLEHAETLEDGDSDSEADSDSDGRSNERFRSGPFTIALPLDSGVITPFSTEVPAGTYEEIEMDVDMVRLRGTFDGEPFDVTLNLNTELEFDFEPPLLIDSSDDRVNVSVVIDALSWLRNPDGSLVDPRTLQTDSSARAAVVNRIRASFKAFEDSDRDADDMDSDSDGDSDD